MNLEAIRCLYDHQLTDAQVEMLAALRNQRPEVAAMIDPALKDLPKKPADLIDLAVKDLEKFEIPTEGADPVSVCVDALSRLQCPRLHVGHRPREPYEHVLIPRPREGRTTLDMISQRPGSDRFGPPRPGPAPKETQ